MNTKRVKIEPGLVIGRVEDPSYSFTFTHIDPVTRKAHGVAEDKGSKRFDGWWGYVAADGWYEFNLDTTRFIAIPSPKQELVMTGTKYDCYNCGSECYDKFARAVPFDTKAWCGTCAKKCNQLTNEKVGSDARVEELLGINGIVLITPVTAQEATPNGPATPIKKIKMTKCNCYNCGKECFDKSGRLDEPTQVSTWCADCAKDCNNRSGHLLGNDAEVQSLLDINGVCKINISTAKKASPTLKDGLKIKIEVGQVWRHTADSFAETIISINDHAGHNYAGTKTNSLWGQLTTEGYPVASWSKDWRLMKAAPDVNPLVGQIYAKSDGWKVKITGIKSDGSVQAVQIGKHSGWEDGKVHPLLTYLVAGKMPSAWKPVNQNIKIEVGQVWKEVGAGTEHTITQIKDGYFGVRNQLGGTNSTWSELTPEGYCKDWHGYYFELITPAPAFIPAKPKVEVGQVWEFANDTTTWKISKLDLANKKCHAVRSTDGYEDKNFGTITQDGEPVWRVEKGQWQLSSVAEDTKVNGMTAAKTKVVVGQVWRAFTGKNAWTVTKIEGTRVQALHSESNVEQQFGTLTIDGYPAWDTTTQYGWELISSPPSKAEVGQIYLRDDGWKIKITKINGTIVSTIQIGNHTVYKDGHVHAHFADLTTDGKMSDRWKLETQSKVKVGQVWKVGTNPNEYLIAEIVGNQVSIISDGKKVANWGTLTADGYPDQFWSRWHLHQDVDYSKFKVAPGQTWSSGGLSGTVTEIKNNYACTAQNKTWGPLTAEGYPKGWGGTWKLTNIDPQIKMKVGQVWKYKGGAEHTITAIKNGKVSVLEHGSSVVQENFGSVTADGIPSDWGILGKDGWHQIRENPIKIKVGQKYRWYSETEEPSIKGKVFTVEKVENGVGKMSTPLRIISIKSDGSPLEDCEKHWELVEDVQEEKMKTTSDLLGKLEAIYNGCDWEISGKYGSNFFEEMKVLGYFVHGSTPLHRPQANRLTPLGFQKMMEMKSPPVQEKVAEKEKDLKIKIGQTWRCAEAQYRITEIQYRDGSPGMALFDTKVNNDDWFSGGGWHIKDGEFTSLVHGMPWILEVDVDPPQKSNPVARPAFRQMFKSDATNAAYRIAAHQLTKGTKRTILSLMEKKGHSSKNIKALSDLLETEVGSAIVGMILGMGLTYAPPLATNGRAQRLATEFREGSMAVAGSAAMDLVLENLLPVIMNTLSGLPKEQVRVGLSAQADEEVPEQEIEKEAHA